MITMTMMILLLLTTNNNNNVRVLVDASLVNCMVNLPEDGESALDYSSCYDLGVESPGSDALYCRSKQDCETVLMHFGSSSTSTQVVELKYDPWTPVLNEEDIEEGVEDRNDNMVVVTEEEVVMKGEEEQQEVDEVDNANGDVDENNNNVVVPVAATATVASAILLEENASSSSSTTTVVTTSTILRATTAPMTTVAILVMVGLSTMIGMM